MQTAVTGWPGLREHASGRGTILFYIILYYTTLYCTILYYTILYYTMIYYTNATWATGA